MGLNTAEHNVSSLEPRPICSWSLAGILSSLGKGPGESDPSHTEAEPTAYTCLEPNRRTQEMVSGFYLPTHLAVPLGQGRTHHLNTGDQLTQGGCSFARSGAWGITPATTRGNGLLPPKPSRKKDPGANKRQTELGTLRQLHGGQAGRQADWGRSLWSLANAGAYCRGFSRADPGTSSGVAGGNADRPGPSLTVLPGPLPASPHPFPELWAGFLWVAVEPHSASLGTSEASARQMGQVRLAFNHLSTHLAWNSWLQGRTRSSCRTSKSLKHTTHRVCSD